ncbi:Undecaprenyl phosphate N,N'-diacetylbacillosamine 1-phosphate transferase [bioreactor metagenome]|uniref:Undecaprenyl phosphate N,N'-diacetylbacillosamine 1-phosphate transferase n=1 Tax=bioreactor metagenome TaxID=1076179 RepID=A0A644ZDR7_9ZZZZ|nr:sugar transferase [Candidatus Metalachnospira sp.]
MYQKYIKRILDVALSVCGLIVLSPIYLILAIAIEIDDPGPIFFRQNRIGIHKTNFSILKFRTMKVNTPKDTPTHLLENPDQYITKIGKFMRKTSLDELPQIAQIFTGKMTIIGPRPALWNQYDLIEERDKYGANDIKPGLTGLAQINGRDELPIQLKAFYDGEYAKKISFIFDVKCFINTIFKVLRHDGVIEGGTGAIKKKKAYKK